LATGFFAFFGGAIFLATGLGTGFFAAFLAAVVFAAGFFTGGRAGALRATGFFTDFEAWVFFCAVFFFVAMAHLTVSMLRPGRPESNRKLLQGLRCLPWGRGGSQPPVSRAAK
jgi:hypothetical protein